MALSMPAAVAPRITTRQPRTSLIDAEWEWLARRAEGSNDDVDTDRVTSPGLAPTTPIVVATPLDAVPLPGRRSHTLLTLAFVATALVSFVLGMVTLPLNAAIASRLRHGSASAYVAAQLRPMPPKEPVTAPAIEPAQAPPSSGLSEAVASPPPPRVEAKSVVVASKSRVIRPARWHAPPRVVPRRPARSDNPY